MRKTLLNIKYKKLQNIEHNRWLLSREQVLGRVYAGCGVIAVPCLMSGLYENKIMAD